MSIKKKIIANWKMNPSTKREAEKLFLSITKNLKVKNTEVIICPPYVYLDKLSKLSKKVTLGAQNSSFVEKGAYTGEVSPSMLYDIGVKHVILGHSERRGMGEYNELINKKLKTAMSAGLTPILCVGESRRENDDHGYFNFVKKQIEECLKGIKKDLIWKVVIAYEPVWAISTTLERRDATPKDLEEMTIFIRRVLSSLTSPLIAKKVKILYGGSVNDQDAGEFMELGGVDGLLVGKASLDYKKFLKIIDACEALKN